MRILLFIIFYFTVQISVVGQKYDTALFTDLFEGTNVGNLHIFAVNHSQENYAFKGVDIPKKFQNFLPVRIRKKIIRKKIKINAVHSIRGNELNNFYILNISQKGQPTKLVLYRLNNRKLKKIKTLASFECHDKECTQTDSWISDFNGDTRLDLLQKTKHISNGKEDTKTRLFLLTYQGKYKKTNLSDIQIGDYKMQSITQATLEK